MSHNNALLQPLVLGNLSLRNRVVMAPMTRNFSPGNVPGDNVVEYYRRRAAGWHRVEDAHRHRCFRGGAG